MIHKVRLLKQQSRANFKHAVISDLNNALNSPDDAVRVSSLLKCAEALSLDPSLKTVLIRSLNDPSIRMRQVSHSILHLYPDSEF